MNTKLLDNLLDNLTTAVLLVDAELRIDYVNSAAEILLETSEQRIQGEPLLKAFVDSEGKLEALLQAALKGNAYTKRKTKLKLASGNQVTVDYVITAMETGGSTSLLLEIQPLDRLLRISREERLVSSHHHTQMLVRGLAHEIKNPLGGIRGAAQLLDKELNSPDLKDYTRVIIEEADRLRNLVDRMLSTPKSPQRNRLNIHQVLERVRQLAVAEHPDQVDVIRDYDPSIPELVGDSEQLIQAILNLTRNALIALSNLDNTKVSPTLILKTRAIRHFTIGSRLHRLVCHIAINDNGPGVPPELGESIFFPMISGRAEGAGLGLALTQSIIGQHNGLLEYTSEPGNTTFSIYLPIEASKEPANG